MLVGDLFLLGRHVADRVEHTHTRAQKVKEKVLSDTQQVFGKLSAGCNESLCNICASRALLLTLQNDLTFGKWDGERFESPPKNKWHCNWCGCCGKISLSVTSRGNVLIKLKNTLNIGCGVNANPLLLASHGAAWWLMVWLRASARLV